MQTNSDLLLPLEDRSDYVTPNHQVRFSNNSISNANTNKYSNNDSESNKRASEVNTNIVNFTGGISTRPQLRLGSARSGQLREATRTTTTSTTESSSSPLSLLTTELTNKSNSYTNINERKNVNDKNLEYAVSSCYANDRYGDTDKMLTTNSNTKIQVNSDSVLSSAIGAEFQRSLLQQQLEQLERENRRLRTEADERNEQLSHTTREYNELKISFESLTHKYHIMSDKLSKCTAELHNVDNLLSKERSELRRIRDENDHVESQLRLQQRENERINKLLTNAQEAKNLDEATVSRMLQDRRKYIPTEEVERKERHYAQSMQSINSRVDQLCGSLLNYTTEEETSYFITRSAVLSASNELEARLQRGERALNSYQDELTQLTQLDQAANEFVTSLMNENKELYEELKAATSELEMVKSEFTVHDDWRGINTTDNSHDDENNKNRTTQKYTNMKSRMRGIISMDEYELVLQQVESLTNKLNKAQQFVAAQTTLSREHEAEMQTLLSTNDELQDKLEKVSKELTKTLTEQQKLSIMLEETQRELSEHKEKLTGIESTLSDERKSSEATVIRLNHNNTEMQQEYEEQIRLLNHDKNKLEKEISELRIEFDEMAHAHQLLRNELETAKHEMHVYEMSTSKALSGTTQVQLEAVTQLRLLLETQLAEWQRQLESCAVQTRTATRTQEELSSQLATLRASHVSMESDLKFAREENGKLQSELSNAHNELRNIRGELTNAQAQRNESAHKITELTTQLEMLQEQYHALQDNVHGQTDEVDKKIIELERSLHVADSTRANLQDELQALRTRNEHLETELMTRERNTHDKEQLMKENLRLHEQYQCTLQENSLLNEKVQALRDCQHCSEQVAEELADLQGKLKELPELYALVDQAKRDVRVAKEEVNTLRAERDSLARRLDKLIEENKTAMNNNADFDRIIHEAGAVVQRLGGQVLSAKQRQSHHTHKLNNVQAERNDIKGVFANTSSKSHNGVGTIGNHADGTPHRAYNPTVSSSSKSVHFSPTRHV